MINYRYLGNSGLKVTELVYGNWLTHGRKSKTSRLRRASRLRSTSASPLSTPQTRTRTPARRLCSATSSRASAASALEIFTKVYWPTGPKGANDAGLSRKHIMESINGSLTRLQTDYVDLYQAHRFDHETPLEETMIAFADIVRQGKALYIGVSEWTAEQIHAGAALARELRIPFVSNQPQYSMLWRVIEDEVIPASREEGLSQIVWSPIAQGVLTGKYVPGAPLPEGSRATDEKGGANMIKRFLTDDVLTRVQHLRPIADELGLTLAQLAVAWVLQQRQRRGGDHWRLASRAGNGKR